jgi:hypothetical protein
MFCLTIILFTSCSSDYDKYFIPEKEEVEIKLEVNSDYGCILKNNDTLTIAFTKSTKNEIEFLELHFYPKNETKKKIVIIDPKDFVTSRLATFFDKDDVFQHGDTVSVYKIYKSGSGKENTRFATIIQKDKKYHFKKHLEEQLVFESLFPFFYSDSISIMIDSNLLAGKTLDYEKFQLKHFPKLQIENGDLIDKEISLIPFGCYDNNENDLKFFYQQDDYGVNAFIGKYFAETHSLIILEKIAWNFGDAGDLQTCNSTIKFNDGSIEVIKNIKTCHSDFEVKEGEVLQQNEECVDSINVIRL